METRDPPCAVSMWSKPTSTAWLTCAAVTSCGIFHVPNPIWGILRPSLSLISWKGMAVIESTESKGLDGCHEYMLCGVIPSCHVQNR